MGTKSRGVIRQYAAGISASLSGFVAGCWLGWLSPAIERISAGETNLNMTSGQISWIPPLMDLGNVVSAIPASYMSDGLGRKTVLLMTAFLFAGTWAITIFGTAAWQLYIALVGAGIGKGIVFTVVPTYVAEIAEENVRGSVSAIFNNQVLTGMFFEFCIGAFVSYRMLNIVSGVIPIIFFLTFCFIPESPYYYLMKRRLKQARKSLAWFRNAEISDDRTNKELNNIDRNFQNELREKGNLFDLITVPGNRRASTIVIVLSLSQSIGGISPLFSYSVLTLPLTGGYFKADKYMIIFGFTLFVGSFIGALLIDKLGRKPLLIFSLAGCALFTGISAVFYWKSGQNNDLGALNCIPYFCFLMFGISFSIGIGIIPSIFVGELFPTYLKSFAASISAISFSGGSFLIEKLYFFVMNNHGIHFMFSIFALVHVSSIIFTIFVVIETKNKTFSEIQDELSKKVIESYNKWKKRHVCHNDNLLQ